MGDALKRLKEFSEAVQDSVGYNLCKVQEGLMPKNAKYLTGFKPAVMELVVDYDKNTYRVIYTVKLGEAIYVLHCFQKKSTQGIKTPKHEVDLIQQRLKEAEIVSRHGG